MAANRQMKAAQHGSILYSNSRELGLGCMWLQLTPFGKPLLLLLLPASNGDFKKFQVAFFFVCMWAFFCAGDEFIELHYVTFGPQSIILIYIRMPDRTMRRIRDASVAKHSHAFN